jgi:dolichol-phosphate mannosyltransferase
MQGYGVIEMHVSHRPRLFGETKCGVGNRLWAMLYDTFGVRWLQKRYVRARVRSFSPRLSGEIELHPGRAS